MLKEIVRKTTRVLWAVFLVSLPVTNFPYFPAALGGSKVSVRPLLLYPLIFLVLITLPTLWKRKLPRAWLPFLVFFLLVLISSFIPIFSGVVTEISEVTVVSRLIRTLVTLFLAGAIYLVVSITPLSEKDLDFTLKWLYIGLIISLIWGTLQLIYVLDLIPNWFRTMKNLQRYISVSRGTKDRLIGLTQEPSWFADQLAALYLPWIYAAVLRGRSVFKRITKWLTVEMVLLGWIGVILVFTLSRSGYLTAAVVLSAGLIIFRSRKTHIQSENNTAGYFGKIIQSFNRLPGFVRVLLPGILLVFVLGAVIYIAGLNSSYISRMWGYWLRSSTEFATLGPKTLSGYIRYIGFGPRFVYWETAFNIFKEYPFFGVGLGNYTFYFQDFLPAQQVGYLPEILRILVPDKPSIITTKNYFARLLAETGLVGTGAYISFVIVMTGQSIYLWLAKEEYQKFWGAGALLAIIAFMVNTFSYDSFAIPNPWIIFGFITAAFQIFRNEKIEDKEFSN